MNIRKMYKNCKLLFHWANLFDRFRFRNKKTSSQRNLIIVRNLSCFFNGRPYSSCRVGVFFWGGGVLITPSFFRENFIDMWRDLQSSQEYSKVIWLFLLLLLLFYMKVVTGNVLGISYIVTYTYITRTIYIFVVKATTVYLLSLFIFLQNLYEIIKDQIPFQFQK